MDYERYFIGYNPMRDDATYSTYAYGLKNYNDFEVKAEEFRGLTKKVEGFARYIDTELEAK